MIVFVRMAFSKTTQLFSDNDDNKDMSEPKIQNYSYSLIELLSRKQDRIGVNSTKTALYCDVNKDGLVDKVTVDSSNPDEYKLDVRFHDAQSKTCGVFLDSQSISISHSRLFDRNIVKTLGESLPSCPKCADTDSPSEALVGFLAKTYAGRVKTYDEFVDQAIENKVDILFLGEVDHKYQFLDEAGNALKYAGLSPAQITVIEIMELFDKKGYRVLLIDEFSLSGAVTRPVNENYIDFFSIISSLYIKGKIDWARIYKDGGTVEDNNAQATTAMKSFSKKRKNKSIMIYYGGLTHSAGNEHFSLVPTAKKLGLMSMSAALIDQNFDFDASDSAKTNSSGGFSVQTRRTKIQAGIQFSDFGNRKIVIPYWELRSDGLGFAINIPPGAGRNVFFQNVLEK